MRWIVHAGWCVLFCIHSAVCAQHVHVGGMCAQAPMFDCMCCMDILLASLYLNAFRDFTSNTAMWYRQALPASLHPRCCSLSHSDHSRLTHVPAVTTHSTPPLPSSWHVAVRVPAYPALQLAPQVSPNNLLAQLNAALPPLKLAGHAAGRQG